VVSDTIVRTIELGVTLMDPQVAGYPLVCVWRNGFDEPDVPGIGEHRTRAAGAAGRFAKNAQRRLAARR
jgi:hypothetical protein